MAAGVCASSTLDPGVGSKLSAQICPGIDASAFVVSASARAADQGATLARSAS